MSDGKKEIYDNDRNKSEKPGQYFVEGYFDSAYSMPAESDKDYSYKVNATSALPAFPPHHIENAVNDRLRPIRMITLGILIILCLLTVVQLIIKYDLEIRNENGIISITIRDGRSGSVIPEDVIYADEYNSITDNENDIIKPNHSYEWKGTAITISEPPAGAAKLSYQQIYKKCVDSLVSIYTVSKSGQKAGTGIILSSDGYILTNLHIISGSTEIIVIPESEKQYKAVLIGKDSVTDLAVLKIDATRLKPAEFGNSNKAEVGDSVVAIGNPLNYTMSMTDGIISAINKKISLNGYKTTLLQTNAELNEGNSGGALVNSHGQIIGITNMKIISTYSSVEGIGFAIPIAEAKPIIEELLANGYVKGRPSIGIMVKDVPAVASVFYEMPRGVYIDYVWKNSDAYLKGLIRGDIIVSANGTGVDGQEALLEIQSSLAVGDTISLDVFRGGKYFTVEIMLMDASDFG